MTTEGRVAALAKGLLSGALWFWVANLMTAVLSAQCTSVSQVPNQTISSGTNCYSNSDTLTAAGVTINGSASVTFVAGRTVHLTPGFRATAGTAGTTFHAWADSVPSAISANPSSGTGLTQAFTWTVSNPEGYAEISEVQALFNMALSGWSACYIRYSRASNLLYLADDSGATWMGGFAPGTIGTASNSRCLISGNGALVSGSGTQLILTVPVTFQAGWAGLRNDYLNVYDSAGFNSGWQTMGSWNVVSGPQYTLTMAASPSAGGSVTPGNGTYGSGSSVNIVALPASGFQFVSWTGPVANPNALSTTVTMNASQAVTANFSRSSSPLAITTASPLPQGMFGVAYSPVTFAATGGTPPYTWSVAPSCASCTEPGLLPAPLELAAGGVLSGTPKRGGQAFGFTIEAKDSVGTVARKDFTLAIGPTVQPISGPSRLEVGLSFMPFDEYDDAHLASSKFPKSCPRGQPFEGALRRSLPISGSRAYRECVPSSRSAETVPIPRH